MKFRTFITALALFLIFFYAGFLFISYYMLNSQMEAARELSTGEHYLIAVSLGKDLTAVANRSGSVEESIRPLFDFYRDHYSRRGVFLEIVRDGETLYSSVPAGLVNGGAAREPSPGTNLVYAERTETGALIFVNGGIPGADGYFLKYAADISEDISSLRRVQRTMLLAGTVFSVLAAVFLYFSLNGVFRPLSLVSAASKKIAAGDYGNKIIIRGRDEVAEMAESFNNMADEIRKHISRMADASDKKQRFADNFSHEVRTPLTAIYGSAEYLQKTETGEEEKYKLTGQIITECRHVLNMADRMLELATLREPEINPEKIQAEELFESVRESVRVKLANRRIDLKWERDIDFLYGDASLLKSLLINLTDNAADACEPGGHILWKAVGSANGNVLTVTDDGKGMSSEQLDRITEPFYRIDKAKRRAEGGTRLARGEQPLAAVPPDVSGVGLGLAICEQICACHNAVLSFKSEKGTGTTASITFTGS